MSQFNYYKIIKDFKKERLQTGHNSFIIGDLTPSKSHFLEIPSCKGG